MAASGLGPYFGQSTDEYMNSMFNFPAYNGLVDDQHINGATFPGMADLSASSGSSASDMLSSNFANNQIAFPSLVDNVSYNEQFGAVNPMVPMDYGLDFDRSMQFNGPTTLMANVAELDITGFNDNMAQAIDREMTEVQRSQSVSTLGSDFVPQFVDPSLQDQDLSAQLTQPTSSPTLLVNTANQGPELIASSAFRIDEAQRPTARRSDLALPAIAPPQQTTAIVVPNVTPPVEAPHKRQRSRRSRAVVDPSAPKRPVGRPRLAPEDHAVPYRLWCRYCRTQHDAQTYKSGEGLRVHMAREHNLVPPEYQIYKCPRCPRKFGTRSELNRHGRTNGPCRKVDQHYWEAQPVTRQDLADTYALPEYGPMSNVLIEGREHIAGRSDPRQRNFVVTLDDEPEITISENKAPLEAVSATSVVSEANPAFGFETWSNDELAAMLEQEIQGDA